MHEDGRLIAPLERLATNPLIRPSQILFTRASGSFNPAAAIDHSSGRIVLLVRVFEQDTRRSCLALALSSEGERIDEVWDAGVAVCLLRRGARDDGQQAGPAPAHAVALDPRTAAGFTRAAAAWEPLQPDSLTASVQVQEADPNSLLNPLRAQNKQGGNTAVEVLLKG